MIDIWHDLRVGVSLIFTSSECNRHFFASTYCVCLYERLYDVNDEILNVDEMRDEMQLLTVTLTTLVNSAPAERK